MKNIGFYMLFAAALSCSSCTDFLEEHPKSFLSPDNFYQTADDINSGLNAVYRAPQDRYSRNWAGPCWFEWGTDICEITDKSTWAHHNEIARLPSTFNASSEIPEDFWEYTFNHVKDANNLLAVLPNAPIDEEDKLLVEGQTRALRAFLYFDAVRVFNGVPLLLESNSDITYLKTVPRATPEEIYAAVIEDLRFAMDVLPEQWESATDYGRITKGGAAAMLAKVYLTMAGYPLYQTDKLEDAKVILQNFIENKAYGSQYELLPEYSQVFDENVGFLVNPVSAGEKATLYKTTDGMKTFSEVQIPAQTLEDTTFNLDWQDVYDTPEMPYMNENSALILVVGQGSDGDYNEGTKSAYKSNDMGDTWTFIEEYIPEPEEWEG